MVCVFVIFFSFACSFSRIHVSIVFVCITVVFCRVHIIYPGLHVYCCLSAICVCFRIHAWLFWMHVCVFFSCVCCVLFFVCRDYIVVCMLNLLLSTGVPYVFYVCGLCCVHWWFVLYVCGVCAFHLFCFRVSVILVFVCQCTLFSSTVEMFLVRICVFSRMPLFFFLSCINVLFSVYTMCVFLFLFMCYIVTICILGCCSSSCHLSFICRRLLFSCILCSVSSACELCFVCMSIYLFRMYMRFIVICIWIFLSYACWSLSYVSVLLFGMYVNLRFVSCVFLFECRYMGVRRQVILYFVCMYVFFRLQVVSHVYMLVSCSFA